jgi:hypothetical protein
MELYIELIEGGEYRGRVQRSVTGELELTIYGTDPFSIPADWLMDVLNRATVDLPMPR